MNIVYFSLKFVGVAEKRMKKVVAITVHTYTNKFNSEK